MLPSRRNTSSFHKNWGIDFPAYLVGINPFFPPFIDGGNKSAKEVMRYLESASIAPMPPLAFSDFYSIIYLQGRSRDLRMLRNTKIVSGCLVLLRQYIHEFEPEGKGFLSHSFGFYCFRALILGIQVGILEGANALDSFIESVSDFDTADGVSAEIPDAINDHVVESNRDDNLPRLLGPKVIMYPPRRMFLEKVGGILAEDVDFIIEGLWRDRDVITYIATRYAPSGWAIILWVVGQHMLWSLQLQENEEYEWDHFQELCFRFSLFASPQENEYLEYICSSIRGYQCFSKASCSNFLVDQNDAANVLEAYISCVIPADYDPYYTEVGSLYIDYIIQDDFLKQPDLISNFVEAALLRIWCEFILEDQSMIGYFIEYCAGIFTAYGKVFHLHSGKTANAAAEALCTNDFVELVGRIVLCPFACNSDLLKYIQRGTDDHFAVVTFKRWDELLRSLHAFTYHVPPEVQPALSSSIQQWKKTRRWLLEYSTDDLPLRVEKYINKCRFAKQRNAFILDARILAYLEACSLADFAMKPNTVGIAAKQDIGLTVHPPIETFVFII